MINSKMYIFGGVDTKQTRFDDLYSYDIEKRFWQKEFVTGNVPRA